MSITIALAGNPNCGKTTMFNDLTGSNQFVGNWPGVTVEKKEGRLKGTKKGQDEVTILVTLTAGQASCSCWGCDLTYDYVKINGDYRS